MIEGCKINCQSEISHKEFCMSESKIPHSCASNDWSCPPPLEVWMEAKHFDDGKVALQWLLSMSGIDDVAAVGMYGAKKYGQSNWRGGSDWMRYAGSVSRHLSSFIRGESVDNESGLKHLAHAAYNCLILLTWEKEGSGHDDRPKMVDAHKRAMLDAGVPVSYLDGIDSLHREIGSGDCEVIE